MTSIVLAGCADVDFIAYEGTQAKWGVSRGALVDRRFDLPVYHGKPPRPYQLLGVVNVSGALGFTDQDRPALKRAVAEAKRHGGDALILIRKGTATAGATTQARPEDGSFGADDIRDGYVQAYAIKWR
jgi:hypothetical protein